jgi:hypothetical protein
MITPTPTEFVGFVKGFILFMCAMILVIGYFGYIIVNTSLNTNDVVSQPATENEKKKTLSDYWTLYTPAFSNNSLTYSNVRRDDESK